MPDLSHLDSKLFIDATVYNCPFCNRRSVAYSVCGQNAFGWTDRKTCYIYRVQCHSCYSISMHLSFEEIALSQAFRGSQFAPFQFNIKEDEDLDSKFFYSVPTSFLEMDSKIPRHFRELMVEATGCLKNNFLVGASACIRKLVYELAKHEKAEGRTYNALITSIKAKRPDVQPEYFDTLLKIDEATGKRANEDLCGAWESKHLRLILTILTHVLDEMYVQKKLREERLESVKRLTEEALGKVDTERNRGIRGDCQECGETVRSRGGRRIKCSETDLS